MNKKILMRYYWILFWIYLLSGIGILSVGISLVMNKHYFVGVFIFVVACVILKDWWSIYTRKDRLK